LLLGPDCAGGFCAVAAPAITSAIVRVNMNVRCMFFSSWIFLKIREK
jgi:hypothetical protein